VAPPAAHEPHGMLKAANILYWYVALPLFVDCCKYSSRAHARICSTAVGPGVGFQGHDALALVGEPERVIRQADEYAVHPRIAQSLLRWRDLSWKINALAHLALPIGPCPGLADVRCAATGQQRNPEAPVPGIGNKKVIFAIDSENEFDIDGRA
jgi:hypothetical protein